MNHWKTTESVTNEAEIIHFGGKVCAELHPRCLAPRRRSVGSGEVEVPEREVPAPGGTSMAISFPTAHIGARGPGARGRVRPPGLSLHAPRARGSRFALD